MAVPYTFGTATSSIPLSQLDSNFNTVITLGNTAIQLGNTVTTLNNMTLANVTISSGNVTITNVTITTANVTTANIGTAFVSGNVSFTSTGNRITGDFTNATLASRVAFQTSTVNSGTTLTAIPNGTSGTAQLQVQNSSSDLVNFSYGLFRVDSSVVQVRSDIGGTGTYLPMTFYAGGSEAMRIAVAAGGIRAVGIGYTTLTGVGDNGLAVLGNVGIGTSSPSSKFDVVGGRSTFAANSENFSVYLRYNSSTSGFYIGSPSADAMAFSASSGSERMRIDSSGNVLVTSAAGLGYGTGSGGTVTQATSKSTAVTLNKPTGQITMNNAALLTNTTVVFTVTNSLCAFVDTVSMNHRNGASYNVWVVPGIGSFDVYLKNISVSTLSDAVTLNFSIIKGATS